MPGGPARHHAVLHTLKKLEQQGFEVTYLPVHEDGLVRLEELEAALREDTALVTIMYANNEIGTIQPIGRSGRICRERGSSSTPTPFRRPGTWPSTWGRRTSTCSLSAHKFHGPKGVGALYVAGAFSWALIEGAPRSAGKRAGTENLAGIGAWPPP